MILIMPKRVSIFIYLIYIVFKIHALNCPHPDADINTVVTNTGLEPGKSATYSCDRGYELFGSSSRTCTENGDWTGKAPICVTNVAFRKPANQSSEVRNGPAQNANDGDKTIIHDGNRCTETKKEDSPWWSVDLLQEYEISHVKITTSSSHDEVQNLEVRVGDSADLHQRNRLCAWEPGIIKKGETVELKCAGSSRGRYVSVQMVGIDGSLSLCEVEVFSKEDLSKERCEGDVDGNKLGLFNRTCYEFQTISGGSFKIARDYCLKLPRGDLVNKIEPMTQAFLKTELDRVNRESEVNMVWIGAQKEPKFISRTWHWIDGTKVESPAWGRDQPNNYIKDQNCIVLDRKLGWLWNDIGCNLNYLHWVCQFSPSCGTPDRNLNTTVTIRPTTNHTIAVYECPTGNKIEGDKTRNCSDNAYWSGEAPSCKYIDCGKPPSTDDGVYSLIDSRTTYGARVSYVCAENYTLEGNDTVTCGDLGEWEPSTPKCLYSWCSELTNPLNGILTLSGRRSGDTATFKCNPGYFMVGPKTLSCVLGGEWSGSPPTCRFVDCGLPESVEDGKMSLINSTTYLGSLAVYQCEENFWLNGPEVRVCGKNGFWEGEKPFCEMINCGKPEIPLGGFVTGYSFDVHNKVNYHCEPGHYMTGDPVRVCTREGRWSGEMPTCTFVDCGHLPPIIKGELLYDNEDAPTFLDSEIHYKCMPNYRLNGDEVRICMRSGQWSGENPRCEEIRCSEPNHPDKSKVSYAGNDRRISLTISRARHNTNRNATYKVGTKVTYRCERGYVVHGLKVRTCLATGNWSAEAPKCRYIDCGQPPSVARGIYRLLSNETSYGALVSYECEENWKIDGKPRRKCLENGTWAGGYPKCIEVLCPSLEEELKRKYKEEDEREIEPWNKELIEQRKKEKEMRIGVDDGDRRVGSSAYYKCPEGQRVVGEQIRICKKHGVWDGSQPKCEWVYCDKPDDVANGRVHLLKNELKFGSVVEYFCLPKFFLHGPFNRTCTQNGTWSGVNPKCTLEDINLSSFDDNTIDGTSNLQRGPLDESLDGASYTGLYVGIAVSLILALGVGLTLFFFKTREKKIAAKSATNGHSLTTKPMDTVPHPAVMTYGDLSDPSTGNNIYEHIPDDVDSNSYANMSPTSSFTSTPPSSYSNPPHNHTYSNSGRELHYANSNASSLAYGGRGGSPHDRIPSHISRRPRMPPPQPPPGSITPSAAGVTVNGVAVNSNS